MEFIGKNYVTELGIRLAQEMPVATTEYALKPRSGLIIVDEIVGFCSVGAGPMAPAVPNAQVSRMIEETDRLARRFISAGMPVMAFRDVHTAGRPEEPYREHCIRGSGHEELVPELRWLHDEPLATVMDKDVINGILGGIRKDGGNTVFEWIKANDLETLFLVGICTDICLLSVANAATSARNHYIEDAPMLGGLKDIVVYEPATATYDLPMAVVKELGLSPTSAHPQEIAHFMGLSVMQGQGVVIASKIV